MTSTSGGSAPPPGHSSRQPGPRATLTAAILGVVSAVLAVATGILGYQTAAISKEKEQVQQTSDADVANLQRQVTDLQRQNSLLRSQTSGPSGGSDPAAAFQGESAPPVYTGAIRLTGDGEDFSQDAPHPIGINVPYYAGQVRYASGRISLEWRNAAAGLWADNRDPSSNQCVATINAQPLSRDEMGGIRYKQSIGICYAFGDNVVFLRGLSPNAADTVQVNATKWAK
jgi:hypothetical protein